ncbi:hypothetical protein AZI86_07215 [Bdellovibrio bacteriovorus]|uniref:Uncharacterized protein n=1 Tax=Bdellovibrio bacteriovorus TaxID=959 RepID=A0A150WQX1_BDEBC|nr:hypothetical protein [Bdellovibrio bacteriovorus]KYG66820.1 hypothetical protein AZI86_07215 [Bdellovibrio bacteriovorus]
MKILFALILIAPLFSFAQTETKNTKVPVKEGYETMDMNQFKDLDRPTKPGGASVKFSSNCVSKTGVQYKEQDSGYAACLREAQMDNAQGLKSGATPSMGVKFGD